MAARPRALLVACLLAGCASEPLVTDRAGSSRAVVAEALRSGDDERSGQAIRLALQQRPRDPALHFANAWSYQRAAAQGDDTLIDLARVGYETAIKLDASFWPAHAALGWIATQRGEWNEAITQFATALSFEPGRSELWVGLASAAYHARLLPLAASAIERAGALKANTAEAGRAGVLIASAAGDEAGASKRLTDYQNGGFAGANALKARVSSWRDIHAALAETKGLERRVQSRFAPDTAVTPPGGSGGASGGGGGTFLSDDNSDSSSGLQTDRNYYGPRLLQPLPRQGASANRMVMVDVSIVRDEETKSTGKGVNLLDGLQIQLGAPTLQQNTDGTTSVVNAAFQFGKILTGALTLPTINYNLNIANASRARAEILARPTLLAMDGQASRFFSGDEITVALPGQYGGTLEHKAIGVGLSVTPTILDADNLLLRVIAERDSMSPRVSGTFNEAVQTSRNTVSVNVSLRFGQTLVLTGLLDQQRSNSRSGIPFLQSIPGIQYFSAREDAAQAQRTLLITLTPRRPDSGSGNREAEMQRNKALAALKARVPSFVLAAHLEEIGRRLDVSGLAREFRSGDLLPGESTFTRQGALLLQALEFLYF